VADRVRRNFADTAARFANGDLVPTVSVGVTLGTDSASGVDMLLEVADRRSIVQGERPQSRRSDRAAR